MYQNQYQMYQQQNPYQSNGYMPSYQSYYSQQQQIPQIQQTSQQQQQVSGIVGRYVGKLDDVNVSEVPMNTVSIFPRLDMDEIYAKSWDGNGNIQTIVYRPVTQDEIAQKEPTVAQQLQEFRKEILQRFDELERPKTVVRPKIKREGVEDEQSYRTYADD